MEEIKSIINPFFTLDYLMTADENKYFDRKSVNIKVSDIANLISAPKDCCKPMPDYKEEFLDVINASGEKDRILLLHIFTSVDQVIRTNNDSTFLRIGDRTKEIKGEDLKNLEYSKGTRHYEDECNMDADISDLNEELLTAYKKKIGAEKLDTWRVLKAQAGGNCECSYTPRIWHDWKLY